MTSISALHQIHFATNVLTRILWMLLFTTGLGVAVYQTWTIMEDFLR